MLSNDNFHPVNSNVVPLITDIAITADIRSRYYANSSTRKLGIVITTTKGRVTLNGDVPDLAIEEQVIAIANQTEGVKNVISHLRVLSIYD